MNTHEGEANMKYRGYTASVEADAETGLLHGEIADITDVVTFRATSLPEVEREFHAAVDAYVAFCRELDRAPAQPA
jgi:predicted HicB family RNase H-like nuclease